MSADVPRTAPENPVEEARRHVIQAEQTIAAQERLIERLRGKGIATDQAEALLASYRLMLVEMRTHLAYEERPGR